MMQKHVLIKLTTLISLFLILSGCISKYPVDIKSEVALLKRNGFVKQLEPDESVLTCLNNYIMNSSDISWLREGDRIYLNHPDGIWEVIIYRCKDKSTLEYSKIRIAKGQVIHQMHGVNDEV